MKLYIGISEKKWNGYKIPSSIEYACVSPVSGRTIRTKKENYVSVPNGVEVIQDSGAFSDSWSQRLSLPAAWDRQIEHSDKHGYTDKLTHRASYDLLIDETWNEGKRSKKRWTYQDAIKAVENTIEASQFAVGKRDKIGLIQSAQGVEPKQYFDCVKKLLPYIDPEKDKLGLGGWCILGMRRELMPVFEQTIKQVIPFVANEGIKSIHIWGVTYPAGLGLLQWWCNQYEIQVSTDSTSPNLQVVRGRWGYAEHRRQIEPVPPEKLGLVRIIHTCQTKHYISNLQNTDFYVSHFEDLKPKCCQICGNAISKKASTCSDKCRKAKSRLNDISEKQLVLL